VFVLYGQFRLVFNRLLPTSINSLFLGVKSLGYPLVACRPGGLVIAMLHDEYVFVIFHVCMYLVMSYTLICSTEFIFRHVAKK